MSKALALISAVLLLCACAAPVYVLGDADGRIWRDNAIGASYTLTEVNGELRLTSAVCDDGETFVPLSSGWRGNTFYWTVEIPSTGYILTYEVAELRHNTMQTRWSNQYDSGEETLMSR